MALVGMDSLLDYEDIDVEGSLLMTHEERIIELTTGATVSLVRR